MNLGIALATLGERESGTARFEEAFAAFRAALEEQTRARVPLDWAATQMNSALRSQRSGAESGTARFEEAFAAYRAALEEQTRARVPLDWAATQMNLGIALAARGAGEGTARLEEAVAAYRAALEERTVRACRSIGPGPRSIRPCARKARGSGRAGRRVLRRRSRPIAPRWRNRPARAFRSTGRRRR